MNTRTPTTRFSDRVEQYVKARPSYPREIITVLAENCGFNSACAVVDVGCGTGLLAERFCEFGCRVIGVEPNAAMRGAGENHLARYPNFNMCAGTAESIPLTDATADFITAGQAFHWFDVQPTRAEFQRVLKAEGWAVLVWNDREVSGSKFAIEYEELIQRFAIDYAQVNHRDKATPERFDAFFGRNAYRTAKFPNAQRLDRGGLIARVASSSYMPNQGHPDYAPMLRELDRIFGQYSTEGMVTVQYTTSVTYGRM